MSYQQWGNSIWYLFHGLAHKLKEEHEDIVPDIVNYFYEIAYNLPCDYCSKHAISVLSRCNLTNISTKEQLKDFLWKFHNIVNHKLKKANFTKEQRDELYEKINIDNAIYNYKKTMTMSINNERAMMGLFRRKECIKRFTTFMSINRYKF